MSSSANKSFFSANALTDASNTSARQQLILGDVDFVAVLVATSTHVDTTVDAKIQHSHDGDTWFDLVSFTQLTDNGSEVKQITDKVLQYVRGVVTLGGATKQSTVTLQLFHDRCF